MNLLVDRRTVGVIGIQQSGKSTFITSLIHHLRCHDPAVFPLGDGRRRIQFLRNLPESGGIPAFPYTRYRYDLHEGRWPRKTTSLSEYRCRLRLSASIQSKMKRNALRVTELTLIDIPGERLADLGIAAAGYPEWSDALLKLLDDHPSYRDTSTAFRDLLDSAQPFDSVRLIEEFKRMLARLAFRGLPCITPSTLLITPQGKYVPREICEKQDANALAELHFAGISGEAEFAPLSARARSTNPALLKKFEQNYRLYRRTIVDPLAQRLYSCDQLLVLVDIPTLLAGGQDVFNGCLHVIEESLRYLAPGRFLWTAGLDLALSVMTGGRKRLRGRFGRSSLRQIAFVAAQADRVHCKDHDKLGELARQMIEPHLDELADRRVDAQFFVCSAVNSTESKDYSFIEAVPLGQQAPVQIEVSPVPDLWPRRGWTPGQFRFPTIAPEPSPLLLHPPNQFGLERVASFMLGIT